MTTPISPPAAPMTALSRTNSCITWRRRTPTASKVPISRTRSNTLINMVLMMPVSTTTKSTSAMAPKMKFCRTMRSRRNGCSSRQVCTSYSGPRFARSTSAVSSRFDRSSMASTYSVTRPSRPMRRWAASRGKVTARLFSNGSVEVVSPFTLRSRAFERPPGLVDWSVTICPGSTRKDSPNS